MATFDLFSKRQKRLRGEMPDIYQYENIPKELRVQINYIISDALGEPRNPHTIRSYEIIQKALCREYGQLVLVQEAHHYNVDCIRDVTCFLLASKATERVLDLIELSFRLIDGFYRNSNIQYQAQTRISPDEVIEELNSRFREHGVGYQFESGEIMRVDSQLLHSEAVKATLHLLSDEQFQGANEEFLKAHEHYRHGNHEESINECLKAFESVMKSICDERSWNYDPKGTAKHLIDVCFKNNLIPTYLQTQFTSLRQNLESGIPTIRNKNAGHGQGSQPRSVPQYFVAYQLHIAASAILFLVEADKALP